MTIDVCCDDNYNNKSAFDVLEQCNGGYYTETTIK